MTDLDEDIPLTEEELALAQRGQALISAAMAAPEARAPQALRESLERTRAAAEPPMRARRVRRPRRWLVAPGLGLACLLVVALALALGTRGAGVEGPSLRDVAAVARLPARTAAPAAIGGARPRLSASVQGLAFPDWSKAFGWTATGRRDDRVGGRTVTTILYRYDDVTMLGYAIVAGPPLRSADGRVITLHGTRYRVVVQRGRTTVTWTQAGHSCVLDASSAVSAARLVALAAWANT
jgi:hypothetical protein